MSAEDLRLRYLDFEEAERLYSKHPELGRDPKSYCPTCAKTGVYQLDGKTYTCDCELQLQLHKHYLAAGIGVTYQRLDWPDISDTSLIKQVIDFAENKEFVLRGRGLTFAGGLGTGKTMVATLCLKEFVREGLSCFATTFADMVELFTAGWHSTDDRKYFYRKVVESRVLLLDDVGKEFHTKTGLAETTFDNVLRTRVQNGRATLLTTNLGREDLQEGYGAAVLRLLREKNRTIEVFGDDFSERAGVREEDLIMAGEKRPIL